MLEGEGRNRQGLEIEVPRDFARGGPPDLREVLRLLQPREAIDGESVQGMSVAGEEREPPRHVEGGINVSAARERGRVGREGGASTAEQGGIDAAEVGVAVPVFLRGHHQGAGLRVERRFPNPDVARASQRLERRRGLSGPTAVEERRAGQIGRGVAQRGFDRRCGAHLGHERIDLVGLRRAQPDQTRAPHDSAFRARRERCVTVEDAEKTRCRRVVVAGAHTVPSAGNPVGGRQRGRRPAQRGEQAADRGLVRLARRDARRGVAVHRRGLRRLVPIVGADERRQALIAPVVRPDDAVSDRVGVTVARPDAGSGSAGPR